MELKGKIINILGDSITEGVGVSDIKNRYADVFECLTGTKVNNYGISGTRIAKQKVPSENPQNDFDFISRADAMDKTADAVVIFGGTNDYEHGDARLGDITNKDPYTFYGACHTLMSMLKENFLGKPIIFMTPLKRMYNEEISVDYVKKGYTLKQYVSAIKDVADIYNILGLDMYELSGFEAHNITGENALTADGLHPNGKGAQIIAVKLKEFMENI